MNFTVKQVAWQEYRKELQHIRSQVFIAEQKVSQTLEWDTLDNDAYHFLAFTNSQPALAIGTARLLKTGKLTRMAVLAPYRRQGAGEEIFTSVAKTAIHYGITEIFAEAQVHALGFYMRLGFLTEGVEFYDAGIPHKKIHLTLSTTQVNPGDNNIRR